MSRVRWKVATSPSKGPRTSGHIRRVCRFESHRARVENREALHDELEARFLERDVAAWLTELGAAGVPAGRINDIEQAFALASSLGLDPIVEVEGKRVTRNPVRLSATPATYRSAPPKLGSGG